MIYTKCTFKINLSSSTQNQTILLFTCVTDPYEILFKVQILAASCLGILGPADLTTLVLQPEPKTWIPESNSSAEYLFIKHIVVMLLDYLSDGNISVMEASNVTLFQILATHNGQFLYGNII